MRQYNKISTIQIKNHISEKMKIIWYQLIEVTKTSSQLTNQINKRK